MINNMFHTAQNYLKENRNKRKMRIALGAFSVIVAIAVLVVLISPGFADEPEYICGMAEHTHTDACYLELTCGISEGHVHDEGCYEVSLTCTIPEGHEHGSTCYGEPPLICGLEEGEEIGEGEIHNHTSSCYGEPELICDIEEHHVHNETCYGAPVLVCTETGHIHDEGCYTMSSEPQCGLLEHVHDESCLPGGEGYAGEPEEDEELAFECPYCLAGIPHGHASATVPTVEETGFMGMRAVSSPIVPSNTWDLRNFVTGVSIKDKNGATVTSGNFIYGDPYTFRITFAERLGLNGQFSYNTLLSLGGHLEYQIPDGITIVNPVADGKITMEKSDKSIIEVGEYTIDEYGLINVVFYNMDNEGNPTAKNLIDNYSNTRFWIEIDAEFSREEVTDEILFSDTLVVIVNVTEPPASLKLAKTAMTYDSAGETVTFGITLTADGGPVDSIVLTDAMTVSGNSVPNGTALDGVSAYSATLFAATKTYEIIDVDTNAVLEGPFAFAYTWDAVTEVWIYDFGSLVLQPGQRIVINYTVKMEDALDYFDAQTWINRLEYGLTLTNSAIADARDKENDKPLKVAATTRSAMGRTLLSKGGSYQRASDKINWTVAAGNYLTQLNGATITDTLGGVNQQIDGDITIKLFDVLGAQIPGSPITVAAPLYSYTGFTLTSGGTGFTFDVPASPSIYRAEISYSTVWTDGLLPDSYQDNPGIYSNSATIIVGIASVTKTANVGVTTPPPPAVDVSNITGAKDSKWVWKSDGSEPEALEYTIEIVVPAGTEGKTFYLSDKAWENYYNINAFMQENSDAYKLNVSEAGIITMLDVKLSDEPMFDWSYSFGAGSDANRLNIYPCTTSGAPAAWLYTEEKTLTITYRLSLDAHSIASTKTLHDFLTGANLRYSSYHVVNKIELISDATTRTLDWVLDYFPVQKGVNVASDINGYDYFVPINWGPNDPGNMYSLYVEGQPAIFMDTFDDRLEYVEGSFYVDVVTADILHYSGGGGINDTLYNDALTIDARYGMYDLTTGEDLTNIVGNSFIIDFSKDFVKLDPWGGTPGDSARTAAEPGWYAGDGVRLIVHYKMQRKDGIVTEYPEAAIRFENTAKVYGTSDKFKGEWSYNAYITYQPRALSKASTSESGNSGLYPTKEFTVTINNFGFRLRPPGVSNPLITGVDEMETCAVLFDTIAFWTSDKGLDGKWGEWYLIDKSNWGDYGISAHFINEQKFEVVFPDETPLKIVYEVKHLIPISELPSGGIGMIRNTFSVFGDSATAVLILLDIRNSAAGLLADDATVWLYKEDADTGERLSHSEYGGEFDLYMATITGAPYYDSVPSDPSYPAPISVNGLNFYYVCSAVEDGDTYKFNHNAMSDPYGNSSKGSYLTEQYDGGLKAYLIVEKTPPAGYVPNTEPLIFSLQQLTATERNTWETRLGQPLKLISNSVFMTNKHESTAEAVIGGVKNFVLPTSFDPLAVSGTFMFTLTQVDEFLDPYPSSGPDSALPAPDYALYSYVSFPDNVTPSKTSFDFEFDPVTRLKNDTEYYFKIEENVVSASQGWYTDATPKYIKVTVDEFGAVTTETYYAPPGMLVPTFVNRWESPETPTADVEIKGNKYITGPGAPSDTAFIFKLTQIESDSDTTPVTDGYEESVTIVGEGEFSFAISKLVEGVYYYLLSEVNGGAEDWEYDETLYLIKVIVTENLGDAEAVVEYFASNGDGDFSGTEVFVTLGDDDIAFTNVYTPPEYLMTISKSWDGDPVVDDPRNSGVTLLLVDDSSKEYEFEYNGDGTFSVVFHEFDFDPGAVYKLFEVCPAGYAPEGDYWGPAVAESGKSGYFRYELQYDLTLELIGDVIEVAYWEYNGAITPDPSPIGPPWELINNVRIGGAVLPETGGEGLKMLMFAGFTMMALAGITLVIMKLFQPRLAFNTQTYSRRRRNDKR